MPGYKKKKVRFRTLHTPRGPVKVADSGWSEEEWRVIQSAMGKRTDLAPAAPRQPELFIDFTQVR